MKTLDEVIKGFVCCQEINCAECPYANWDNTDVVHCNDTEKEDDAFHYLWEYRTEQNILSDRKEHYEYWENRYYHEVEKVEREQAIEMKHDELMPKWTPVTEALPEKKEMVLITNNKGHVRCGQYQGTFDDENYRWWWKHNTLEEVLAWMPLPEPWRGEK